MLIPPAIEGVLAQLSSRKSASAVTLASIESIRRSILRAFSEGPPNRPSLVRALEMVQRCLPSNTRLGAGVVVDTGLVPELEILAREIEAELARGPEASPEARPGSQPGTTLILPKQESAAAGPPPSNDMLSAVRVVIRKLAPLLRRRGTSEEVGKALRKAISLLDRLVASPGPSLRLEAANGAVQTLQECLTFIASSARPADAGQRSGVAEALASLELLVPGMATKGDHAEQRSSPKDPPAEPSLRSSPSGAPRGPARTLPLIVAPPQPMLLRDEGEKWPAVPQRRAKRRRPRPPRVVPESAPTAWVNRLTPFAVGATVLRERDGREVVVVVVKGTFEWDAKGRVSLAAEQRPLQDVDGFAGKPGVSSIIAPSDFTLAKPRVDLLVQGEIVFAQPVEVVDVALQVGAARKILRVYGDRAWVMGAAGRPVPSRAVPLARVPIVWERSFGGHDPSDPSRVEPSNPIGLGFADKLSTLVGTRAPNFEDPTRPVEAGGSIPAGFGAIAPHWSPRRELAGTYDAQWEDHRCPLVPDDFDDRHHNVAPIDQQLDEYQAGMEIVLTNMTAAGIDQFCLPRFECPLALVDAGYLVERSPRVDTVIIEPATRTLLVTARLVHAPRRTVLDVAAIFAGELSRGRRHALMSGKRYVRRHAELQALASDTPQRVNVKS